MGFQFSKTLVLSAGIMAAGASLASAQSLVIATDKAGSLFNAMGAGFAKTVTDAGQVRVLVRPFAGPDAYLDALNKGELQLAALSAPGTHVAVRGFNKLRRKYKNLRIIRSGRGSIKLGFIVPKSSSVKSLAELKGKKIPAEFGGHAILQRSVGGGLKTAGLSWNDVQKVPVTGTVDAIRALGTGRVDATWAPLGMPAVREVNAKIGIRYLSFPDTPEALAIMRKSLFPGALLIKSHPIPPLGVMKPTVMLTFDSYLLAHKDVKPVVIEKVLNGLWDKTGALVKIHPSLRAFTHKSAVTDIPLTPYHPAAVVFYKKKGVWNDAAEAANNKIKAVVK